MWWISKFVERLCSPKKLIPYIENKHFWWTFFCIHIICTSWGIEEEILWICKNKDMTNNCRIQCKMIQWWDFHLICFRIVGVFTPFRQLSISQLITYVMLSYQSIWEISIIGRDKKKVTVTKALKGLTKIKKILLSTLQLKWYHRL